MPSVDPAGTRLDDAVRDLRALRIGADAGLFDYVGLDRRRSRHMVWALDRPRSHPHVLGRGDVRPWVEGVALGQGDPATVDKLIGLDRERSPKLITLEEAARRIPSVDVHGNRRRPAVEGMSLVGIRYMIDRSELYPVFVLVGVNPSRRVFAAQVDALAAARHALAAARDARDRPTAAAQRRAETARARAQGTATVWAGIAAGLPPVAEITAAGGTRQQGPRRRQTAALRLEALRVGTAEGWFELLWPVKEGYLVQVTLATGASLRRVVAEAQVLPWVEGFGCWHRRERVVTFR